MYNTALAMKIASAADMALQFLLPTLQHIPKGALLQGFPLRVMRNRLLYSVKQAASLSVQVFSLCFVNIQSCFIQDAFKRATKGEHLAYAD